MPSCGLTSPVDLLRSNGALNDRDINLQTVRHFWQVSRDQKKEFWFCWLIPLNNILLYTVIPFIIGKIFAVLTSGNGNINHLLVYLVVTAILASITNRYGFLNLLTMQAWVLSRLQSESLNTLMQKSANFHANRVSGKLVSDSTDYVQAYSQISDAFFTRLVSFAVIIVSGVAVVAYNSLLLGGFLLLMTVLTLGSGIVQSRRRAPLRKERLVATKAATAHLADTIVNNQTVKTFAQEDMEMSRHHLLNKTLRDLRLRDWRKLVFEGSQRVSALLICEVLFIVLLVHEVQHDPGLLAVGIFAFSYTINLTNRLFDVNILLRTVEDCLLQSSPMTEIMMKPPKVIDRPGARPIKVAAGGIQFEKVVFRYKEGASKQEVFNGLNLRISPGEKIGLVGPSGGGKSTLTRLLLRFNDIESGSITIDGQNIAEATQASLRQNIAYVPQEPLLFHRSILQNIAYGSPEASLGQIRKAAHLAYADEFIQELSSGYDTVVGERGVKLSGGQRQRIAVARAMLKDAPILVLDEATSALDSESEKLIQAGLQELMKGHTTIVVAHRLSTIQKMDRIIVLDKGKITEEGTHRQLLARKGLYARLWTHQSGGFIEE